MGADAPTTPKAAASSEGEAPHFFCERCWVELTVPQANDPRCAKCRGDAPLGGFRALPIRFKSRFLFLSQLGRGGQGAVFRAQDLEELDANNLPEERAVKVMRLDAPDEQRGDLLDRFGREASASKKFSHELRDKASRRFFVASVADDLGRVPYIALELVLWPTLTKHLRERGAPPTAVETIHLGVALLAGVAVMHDKRVVHRDLKPDNLFVSDTDGRFEVKIADFGIWTELTTATPDEGSVRRGIVGTLKYMSPEQQRAQAVDARAATVQPAVGAFNGLSLLARSAAEVERSIAAATAATAADLERLRARIQQLVDEGLRLDGDVAAEHWLLAFREGSWGDPARFVASSTLRPGYELGDDITPSRIIGLLGNAMEWLRAPDAATNASYIGGSHELGGADLLQNATTPTSAVVTERNDQLGFRCEAAP